MTNCKGSKIHHYIQKHREIKQNKKSLQQIRDKTNKKTKERK